MDIETITLIFLIVLFLTAEIYRVSRSSHGIIVSFEESEFGFLVSPTLMARVKLNDGSVVSATVNSCTACMGRLAVGSQVRVYRSSDGHVVDTPWIRKKISFSCGKECN
jgi:hypothetical protein